MSTIYMAQPDQIMKALHTIQHHVVMLLDKHVVQVF
jgi:hypothetical protein